MALAHNVGAPGVQFQGAYLLRRLTIECPVTGRSSDTGFELIELPSVTASEQRLVACLECGQDHDWRAEELRLG